MRHPLPIRSYRKTSTESVVNCMVEAKPADQLGKVSLIRAPGIRGIYDIGGVGRGLALFNGRLYALVGDDLVNVSTSGGTTARIGSIPGQDRVGLAATVDRLCVITEGRGYLMSTSESVVQITDPEFGTPSSVDFVDQYLAFTQANSPLWFTSDVNAPDSYDPLMSGTAEYGPDDLVGLIADHGQVLLAGETNCELWENVGSSGAVAGFPFERVIGGVLELGCAAGQSLARIDNTFAMLCSDLTVRFLRGNTLFRISTHGIEEIIRGWGDVSNCYGMSYSFGGHLVYVLTCPDRGTVCYDCTTNEWHERKSYGYSYWRIVAIASYNERVFLLDEDGRVGTMDAGVYTEFGDIQRVEFTCAPIYAAGRRVVLRKIDLMVDTQ